MAYSFVYRIYLEALIYAQIHVERDYLVRVTKYFYLQLSL